MSAIANGTEHAFRALYLRGLRTSLRHNAGPYGYSVMITASLAAISGSVGMPSTGEIFLFCAGAVSAFLILEALASRGFRERLRGEPADVVVIGSAVSFASVGAGVGAAALSAVVLEGSVAWPLGSLTATTMYLAVVAIEMALAERAAPAQAAGGEEGESELA